MLKKFLPIVLFLASCSGSVASATPLHFGEKRAGLSHALQVNNLKMDAKGVPSFDYTYTQQSGSCKYVVSGKAVAGHEEANGKVELEIHNPQRDNGGEAPAILTFYDGEDNFIIPYKEVLRPKSVVYLKVHNAATRAKACDKKKDRIEITMKKTAG